MSTHALLRTDDPEKRALLNAILRRDLASFTERCFAEINGGQTFLHNWHFEAIAWELMQVFSGETRRLLITLPPRSLKSLSASIAFPAWLLGRDPTRRVICVSYAGELSVAHANSCRRVMSSGWYRRTFPNTRIDPAKDTENETRTTVGGYRMSTTTGGSLTGRGGSVIVIDDPMKAADAQSDAARTRVKTWYDETLLSRLDDKTTGAIVLVMQRLHLDDLAGHVLQQGGWRHLDLPAIAEAPMRVQIGPDRYFDRPAGTLLHPEREPQDALDELKRAMGSQAFSAQYQQRPVPAGGNLVKWSWFGRYDTAPRTKNTRVKLVQSWDTASKSHELADYSVGITAAIKGDQIWILDVLRLKLDYPDLRKAIRKSAHSWEPDTVLIEDKGSGTGLLQDLRRENMGLIGIVPDGDKLVRMSTCSAPIESGQVLLPKAAPWLDDFKTELMAFPDGHNDDQVDALSQLINWNRTKSRYDILAAL